MKNKHKQPAPFSSASCTFKTKVNSSGPEHGPRLYAAVVAPERRRLRRDFLRSAFAQWITPFLAALSNAEIAALKAVLASSLLPFFNAAKNFLSRVLKRDLTLLLTNCLRALLRTLRSADFLLGISYFLIYTTTPSWGPKNRTHSTLFLLCVNIQSFNSSFLLNLTRFSSRGSLLPI